MFTKHLPDGYGNPLPGIQMKTLCYGDQTLMTEFILERGTTLPLHAHPHEQTGYLVKGRIRLTLNGEEHDTLAVIPDSSYAVTTKTLSGSGSGT